MKTKMLLTAIAVFFTAYALFAQAPVTFGVRGGVNFNNINGKEASGKKRDHNLKTGFNIGANAEIPVGIDFYVQPGVLFTTKGAKDFAAIDDKLSLSYIEVPINFIYKPDIGKGHLILGFGPYVAFGIGGKYTSANGNERDVKYKNDITQEDFASGNVYFKGLDAGANLLFGYEFSNKLSAQLNAGLGLVDYESKVDGSELGETTYKNTNFGISLGYRF